MSEEYLTFDETVTKLGVSEDELLNMVSSNTLRAFRIDRETKFKLEDVEAVAGSSPSSGNIELEEVELAPVEAELELAEAPEEDVIELEELPEDVVMLDDVDDEQAKQEPVLDFDDIADDVEVIEFSDESFEIVEDEQDAAGAEIIDEAPEVLDPSSVVESNPEFEETVITDSSSIENTEELSLDDEDYNYSTEEITVQEDVITEDEINSEQEDVEDYIPESSRSKRRASHRSSRRRSERATNRHRSIGDYDKPVKFKTDLVWTAVLAALVVIMIYPTLMMASLLFYGFTTGPSSISVGQQKYDGEIRNISPVFVPKIFKWMQGDGVRNFLGSPTYGKGYTGNIPFKKRLDMGMIKLDDDKPEEKSSGSK